MMTPLSVLCLLLHFLFATSAKQQGWLPPTSFLGDAPGCTDVAAKQPQHHRHTLTLRGGGSVIPAGWNPFGYKITSLGHEFLKFEGSVDSDVGRFISSLKTKRVRYQTLKDSWLEIVRASKSGNSMRILRQLDDLIKFCLAAGLID